jgi:hypothetical protein
LVRPLFEPSSEPEAKLTTGFRGCNGLAERLLSSTFTRQTRGLAKRSRVD